MILCAAFGPALDRAIGLQKGTQSPSSQGPHRHAQRFAYLEQVLKAGYNPYEPRDWHGRWTVGGGKQKPNIQTAQTTIPLEGPWDLPLRLPRAPAIPKGPTDFPPVPFIGPAVDPREGTPKNPYPDRPECEKEWENAIEYCIKLMTENGKNRIGQPGYRGVVPSFSQCVRGQVSDECGGNSTGPIA